MNWLTRFRQYLRVPWALALGAFLCASDLPAAETVTYQIKGKVNGRTTDLVPYFDAGEPFVITFSFDPRAADQNSSSATFGAYDIHQVTFRVGDHVYSSTDGPLNVVANQILNGVPVDSMSISTFSSLSGPVLVGTGIRNLTFNLNNQPDTSNDVFDDDSLPLIPPSFNLSLVNSNSAQVCFLNAGCVTGGLQEIVRAPIQLTPGDLIVVDQFAFSANPPSGLSGSAVWRVDPVTGDKDVITAGGDFGGGVEIGPQGEIFVTDFIANQLIRLDSLSGSRTVLAANGLLIQPFGLSTDINGDLLIADEVQKQIIRHDPDSGVQSVVPISGALNGPRQASIDMNHDYLVYDSAALKRVNRLTGQLTTLASGINSNTEGIAFADNGDVFVTNFVSDAVVRVNSLDGTTSVITSGNLLQQPFALARENSGTLIVGDDVSGLVRVDPSTGQQTLLSADFSLPIGIAVVPEPELYFSAITTNTVTALDGGTLQPVTTMAGFERPFAVAVSPDGSRGYVANEAGNEVSVVDLVFHIVVGSIPVAGGPQELAVTPDGTRLYVSSNVGDTVRIYDLSDYSLAASLPIESPGRIAFTPDGSKAYVVNPHPINRVSVIDTATLTVVKNITVGNVPFEVVVTPNGRKAYVANFNDRTMSVIDTSTDTVTKTIALSAQAGANQGLALSPDGTRLYAGAANVIEVIDTQADKVLPSISISNVNDNHIPAIKNLLYSSRRGGVNRLSVRNPLTGAPVADLAYENPYRVASRTTPALPNTPTGTRPIVFPLELTTNTRVNRMEFLSVTKPGVTGVVRTSDAPPLPPEYVATVPGEFFRFASTAAYSNVVVCVPYDDTGYAQLADELVVTLLHLENGVWVQNETAHDTGKNHVCGFFQELGLFAAVKPANQPPVATSQNISVDEDAPLNVLLSGSDPDGDPLTFSIVSPPQHGILNTSSLPQVTYVPNPNYNGPDSFTFVASDGFATSAPGIIDITVLPVNDRPTIGSVGIGTIEGALLRVTIPASDIDGDALQFFAPNGLPAGATLNEVTGELVWQVPYDVATGGQIAEVLIRAGVTDGLLTAETTIRANVQDVPSGTASGEDVVVQPVDSTTGTTPVNLTFDTVLEPGLTTVATTTVESAPPGAEPPGGFKLSDNTYFDVDTTAEFSGTVQLCFDYAGFNVDENNLRLYHLVKPGNPLTAGGTCSPTELYSDRNAFTSRLDASVVDDYSASGYSSGDINDNIINDRHSDIHMSAVLGETRYQATQLPNGNFISNQDGDAYYCAGCNGSFRLDFTGTSVGNANAVYAVGFEFFNLEQPFYVAFVTFGDGTTANYQLPAQGVPQVFDSPLTGFWGITSDRLIKTIHFGLADGQPTNQGNFGIDNLTIGSKSPTSSTGCWEDITQASPIPAGYPNEGSPNPDTANTTICGVTASFSLFALVEQLSIDAPVGPVQLGNSISASVPLADPGSVDSSVWDWGDGTSPELSTGASASHTYAEPGVYIVRVTLKKGEFEVGSAEYRYVVIYDPNGGFVTGGGWIMSPEGAYAADPTLSGKATFGFVSKYKKGATEPDGNTEFQFKAAGLDFKSSTYEWLVISGARAQFKGAGSINGLGDYGFLLTAIDGQVNGGGSTDRFRIKIWDIATGSIIYDNQPGDDDVAGVTTELGGGSITIHDK